MQKLQSSNSWAGSIVGGRELGRLLALDKKYIIIIIIYMDDLKALFLQS